MACRETRTRKKTPTPLLSFHRARLPFVADKSVARWAKGAIAASRAPREDARLVVQREATADDDGLPTRVLLRKFPPIWQYARVSLGKTANSHARRCETRENDPSRNDETKRVALPAQIPHDEAMGAASLHRPQQLRRGQLDDAGNQPADHVRDVGPVHGSTGQAVLELLEL